MTTTTCGVCEGRGWEFAEDGGAGTAKRCSCQHPSANESIARQLLQSAGMEEDEIASAFAPWDTDYQPDIVLKAVESWARKLAERPQDRPETTLITIMGGNGRSKTTIASKAARSFVEAGGVGLVWLCIPEWAEQVMTERRTRDMPEVSQSRAAECRFLIMDELAAESTPAQMTLTENVLTRRHRRRLPTLVTTNAKSISDLGDGRVTSRISSGWWRTVSADKDYRTFKKSRSLLVVDSP